MPAYTTTQIKIMDIAEHLMQQRGYNAFSYQDIADEMGMRKASLHYHFASKAALGEALAERLADRTLQRLEQINQLNLGPWQSLEKFINAFILQAKITHMMDLGGIMAAEYATLPEAMQNRTQEYFTILHAWLTGVLDQGRTRGLMYFGTSPDIKADAIISLLKGAILLSVARQNGDFIDPLIEDIKASLGG